MHVIDGIDTLLMNVALKNGCAKSMLSQYFRIRAIGGKMVILIVQSMLVDNLTGYSLNKDHQAS
jgi:hypothetical protein